MEVGGGPYFTIRSNLSGLVLDVKDNSCTPGNPVVTWSYNGGQNQLWYLDHGSCCIRSALDPNYCLEVMGDQLVVNLCDNYNSNQRWYQQGDLIRNRDTDQVLDIADHCTDEGARVCSWDMNGGPNQQWSFDFQ